MWPRVVAGVAVRGGGGRGAKGGEGRAAHLRGLKLAQLLVGLLQTRDLTILLRDDLAKRLRMRLVRLRAQEKARHCAWRVAPRVCVGRECVRVC